MISSVFTCGLKEAHESHLKPTELYKLISSLALDVPNQNIDELDLSIIAMYIHQLFVSQNPLIRSELLKIVLELEILSHDSIVEEYNFDKLVANSLEQKVSDTFTDCDNEKSVCFSIVSVMLHIRHYLPKAIIRALISLYYVPKHNYKPIILSYLAQHCMFASKMNTLFNEINYIFIESLGEGSTKIIPYLLQQAEDYDSPARYSIYFSQILVPIFDHKYDVPRDSLISILHSWAGFFFYGIEKNILPEIFLQIPSDPSISVSIIKGILKLDSLQHSILTPYRSYLISYLIQNNIIESLSAVSSNQDALELLNELVRLSCTKTSQIDDLPTTFTSNQGSFVKDPEGSSSELFTLFNIFSTGIPSKDILSLVSNEDPLQLDWTQIHNLILRVLPYDETMALAAASRNFYDSLLNFFTNQFMTINISQQKIIVDVLYSFFDFLLPREYGFAIIASSNALQNLFLLSIHNISCNHNLDPTAPLVQVFKFLCSIIVKNEGTKLIQQWEIANTIFKSIAAIQSLSVAKLIIESIKLYPCTTIAAPMYLRLLMSKVHPISHEAILGLYKKVKETPNFHINVFLKILVPFIKHLDISKGEEMFPLALTCLCDIMMMDNACIIDIMGDSQMHSILSRRSHAIYSLILSREEALSLANTDNEIEWWLTKGNLEYVSLYNNAVEKAFSEKSDKEINIPPHLFGQLSKTQTGLAMLSTVIPRLIDDCNNKENIDIQRGAFFAIGHLASQAPEMIVSALDLASIIYNAAMNSYSYTLRGTLIVCLSLFAKTKYLSRFLEEKGWQIVNFKEETAVVPSDPTSLIVRLPEDEFETEDEGPRYKGKFSSLIMQLSNIITMKAAKSQLVQIYREQQDELLRTENALAAMEQISEYSFNAEARAFVYGMFRTTSLMGMRPVQVSEEEKCEARVRVHESLQQSSPKPFSQITWQKYEPKEMTNKKILRECPELYLKDDLFQSIVGHNKHDFYQLTDLERRMIRDKIYR
ncbi:hypothetical protein TVAG_028670 [Trichomonas vaginalis G3]|uniref:Uncharacterized protein n=1 Tax=Trichomonas vaginalis (strain ATCC PRA-98 / G3) TaxID=412133 RepID=A2E0B4_TRIV3|nr:cytosolic regulator pianissimo family [Trichomonas vaginalis G3]EAY13914.1 hypothetical protein TVAG_028670 [Trichomonas vaginalis G3]KAI5520902.1 cytosolic regulator pianissimo family [Trichomonas vaginalis G3]|eukprot:XP_001326137.1 hypothetical protein [Trichomonas vaginalis G3]